ncbi:magnesium transporter [Herbivorax sp. ANBcel31]|uniref:magnesium transporter n=1 Tax=Herbivorax sp. ANBcel31 TaxID=3069754 RepID=UPI0027B604DB|nr:magnesium transporter [Herbivorax sp. ANBcel31]MDQ2086578.1 magnesium transporter [Herbivorax sp. ANBcel31]
MNFEKEKQLIEDKKYSLLKEELKNVPPVDIAELLDSLDDKKSLLVFRLLPKEIAVDVFSHLSVERQLELSDLVNESELSAILKDLYFDDKVDLLEEMPANVVKKILKNTSEVERKLINQFLNYPEYSAGSLMTIEFVDLKKEMLVSEAIERIRKIAPDKETIYTCYVTDASRNLEGTISLKDLVLAKGDSKVGDIMQSEPIHVNTHDDQENVADIFKKYDLLAAPVVDNEHRLVGIITVDDIVDVIEEEATEDIYRLAAIEPTDEEYINAGIFKLARKRILWLMVLMISATMTEAIIRGYEETLEAVVALAASIPLLMDTGGNAGAQASTLVIRSIVLGEVTVKDLLKVIWKETRISLLVGVALAFVNFLRLRFISGQSTEIALTVALTLIVTVIVAKMLGGILPLLAKRLKLDPAIMAAPLITTIVDSVALIIYFYFAMWIINF